MVIDLDRCTACQACTVACIAEYNVGFADPSEALKGRAIFCSQVMSSREGEYPQVSMRYIPMPCMHCDNPPCVKVCPVRATYKNPEGIVAQVYNRCIGCRYCTVACPYTRRFFNWYEPSWPAPMERQFNPEVSVRTKGVVEKCTFCVHKLRKAQEDARQREAQERARRGAPPLRPDEVVPLRDEEVLRLPACCETCPSQARYFGDLDDPNSTVSKLAQSRRAFRLEEHLGTHPKVIYLAEGDLR